MRHIQPVNMSRWAIVFVACVLWCNVALPVQFGQIDQFEDGNTSGWTKGFSSTIPPTVVAGDSHFLRTESTGTFGADSKMTIFNQTQWTGNYNAAAVDRITFDVRNDSANGQLLYVRLALRTALSQFASTQPIVVANDGQWHAATVNLNADSMTRTVGSEILELGLESVADLRIVSAQSAPSFFGDAIPAVMWLDNIRATFIPARGDVNEDRIVDGADLGLLYSNWNQPGVGDIDQSGLVDGADVAVVYSNWTGDVAEGLHSVNLPECCAPYSFLLGSLGVSRFRRVGGQLPISSRA